MAPVYRIRNPDATYTDISSYFPLYTLDVATNAEEGSVAQSTITAHDPDGTFDIVGHRQLRIHEDTATGSNTMIYVGFVGDRRISRGPNRTTTGRDWEIDLVDPNSILARRILTGTDSNRPAETDVARIQWLVSTNESGMVNDSLYVQTTGPVAMDAKDYTGQRFNEVIDDCAQASGKNYHLWYRESTGTFSLWYDFDTSTSQTSPLRLTNVASEVDNSLTFAISDDTQLTRSPDRVNSGIYLPFDGPSSPVYVQNGVTSNTYARRDVVMPAENVTTLAKATARATRYLTTMNGEEDVITTTVIVPAAKVNFLTAGMRVQFKASHFPGYEDYVWTRALNRSVNQVSEEFYALKLELSPAPPPSAAAPSIVQMVYLNDGFPTGAKFAVPATEGNTIVAAVMERDWVGGYYVTGFTPIAFAVNGGRGSSLQYRVVGNAAAEAAVCTDGAVRRTYATIHNGDNIALFEIRGSYAGIFAKRETVASTTAMNCGGSVTPTAGSDCLIFGVAALGTSDFDSGLGPVAEGANVTGFVDEWTGGFSPYKFVAYKQVTGASGSYVVDGTLNASGTFSGVTAVFIGP